MSTLFDFWVVITGSTFQKSVFVDVMDKRHKQSPHRKPSMPALFPPLPSFENLMFWTSSRAVTSIQKEKNLFAVISSARFLCPYFVILITWLFPGVERDK